MSLPLGLCPLIEDEQETVDWCMEWAIPKRTITQALEVVRVMRTSLFGELMHENFAKTDYDYGYGGMVPVTVTDHEALQLWIEDRERRILGMTLEEWVRAHA